jgi:adenine-specific DNA-methyltransferase
MTSPSGYSSKFLDFFAGSGSLGQAVLAQNAEDASQRRYILVQLPEPLPSPEINVKTIADLAKSRIRNVGEKLAKESKAEFDFAKGSDPDRGFAVFKLAESNFTTWNAGGDEDADKLEKQLELHVDHLRKGRKAHDFLYEILLKSGFPLTARVEQIKLGGQDVFSVADGALFICLQTSLTLDTIRAIAERKPERVVCLDEGFAGNDQLKTNAVQTFKDKGVVFRTV